MDIDTPPTDPPPVDAVLLVGFGGPEGPDDVLPFMENVTRGRGIPRERLEEVSRHYLDLFGGVSPINAQCRALQAALQEALPDLPVYWGNRNWHPFLAETLAQMTADGKRHAIAVVTSAFPSYSGCRQYREDIA
ncbi:MAG: ferrochelatase, partial [Mycobacteriales bacterium]